MQIDAIVHELRGLADEGVKIVEGGEIDISMKRRKLLEKVLAGSKDIRFNEIVTLVEAFGFHLSRVRGSHHIFVHPQVQELVNLQNVNGKAKPYQIRQFLELVERYNLELGDEP
jgi:predicted RNA binding protein YcfA (HicA-like mRNA interferase family)